MLYQRWLEISGRYSSRPAIYDGRQTIRFCELATAAADAPPVRGPLVVRSGGIGFFVDLLRAWRDGRAAIPVERDAPEPTIQHTPPPDIRLVKHTPGARGTPRGIFFTGEQLAADVDRIVATMGLSSTIPNLAAISVAHSYGFSSIALPLLLHGVPVHLAPLPFPRLIEEIWNNHGPMTVPAVPSIWRAWHRAGILDRNRIALAVSAGAPLSLALEREVFESSGLKIHNFYGTSQCGGIAFDASCIPRKLEGCVGKPLPGVSVTTNPEGRLLVRSDAVAQAYAIIRDDDVLGNGRYLTLDLGTLNDDGEICLTGACGSAINVAGRKVSPAKIEAAILATGMVVRARISALASSDLERCQEIAASIRPIPGVAIAEIKVALSKTLEAWEIPRHWEFHD
jgi:long-chain acyl-CoA synthetase